MIKFGLKTAASFLMLAMLFCGSNRVMAQGLEGDLNGDGTLDVADMSYLVNLMAGNKQQASKPENEITDEAKSTFNAGWEDLELPSGRKWAKMNLGANNPGDFGHYFAWGEIVPHAPQNGTQLYRIVTVESKPQRRIFDWASYKFNSGNETPDSINKYQANDGHANVGWYDDYGMYNGDEKYYLEDADEAVKAVNKDYRMPNLVDVMELVDTLNTIQIWGKYSSNGPNDANAQGNYGCYFVSRYNNNKWIFLPAAGQCDDKYLQYRADMNGFGHCFYWTSALYEHDTSKAYVLDVDKYLPGMDMRENEDEIAIVSWYNRCLGCSIRPVLDDK